MPALYQNNQDIPEDMLLGNMLFYSLTEMTVSENDLLDAFKNNNLPQTYVRKISRPDVFRRATSSIKNEKVTYVADNGDTFEGRINVDEVVNDKLYIKRIVGVRVLNDLKEEVSYIQLGSVLYDRANDAYQESIDPKSSSVAETSILFKEMSARFITWSTYHNYDTVKNIINHIVYDMHPIALMPTGICKFIPKKSKDMLYNLKGLLAELSQYSDRGGTENTTEIIPILDTQEHRNLVNKMYEEEIKESLYEYSMELTYILKNRQTLSSRQAASYLEKYKELKDKVSDYESLLGTYTESIQEQLKAAFQRIDDNKEV